MDRCRETRQMPSDLKNQSVSTKRRRIAKLAEQSPEMSFTSLHHLIDIDWLKEAFRLTRKSGAPGIDGQTAKQYAENLEENLRDLLRRTKSGTYKAPPVLANIYLHYVLDEWFEKAVRPRLENSAKLIRYADDFVIVFANREDALRVMEVLPKRMGKYGLAVHPGKTRLVDFRDPWQRSRRHDNSKPETFDLLGFTHYWGKSRKGNPTVRRQTMSSRLTRAIRAVYQWCRKYRHRPVREQWAKLCQKIRGHYAYYGLTGNNRMLADFKRQVTRAWHKWLARRNRRRKLTWEKFTRLLERYPLPEPKIYHYHPVGT